MRNADDMTADEALRDEAVAWLVRVQSDLATAEDWAALTAWLEASEANLLAFEEAERLSAELTSRAGEIASGLKATTTPVIPLRPRVRRTLPAWAGLAAAAAVALVIGPVAWRSYQGTPTVYVTRPGETRDVALADGSHIRMDAASTLTVQLGWRERRVQMAEAQATFDVAKDKNRPFLISVGDQQVRVVGTEFNIRHFDGATRVTVRRGIVEVRQPALGTAPVARLVAGQSLSHVRGATRSVQTTVDPDRAFAWTEGRMVCEDETLGDMVAYLNRRYPVPIRVAPALAGQRFSGVLELGDQDLVAKRLAGYFRLTVHRTDGQIELR
ncbi:MULTISPECIES: FecR family protein [unclassified Caulobacter]|uniref:FecR family protein n=1 Tax=unclassified Caulobacter TaxID=2648921 RepID=UPI000D3CAD06|nr:MULTISPECIES: FecR domain-containing protein [unclassified Caulobacter]PTS87056.1 iron dicitrate transport regulator FecR [Caulobacter sp. HMWF009]PTT08989.1 iron dicitrate transport regulator FecR [Caulobacter sp. HMWF025]